MERLDHDAYMHHWLVRINKVLQASSSIVLIGRAYLHGNLVHALCSHPVIYEDSLTDSLISCLLNLCAKHAAPLPTVLISLEKRYI